MNVIPLTQSKVQKNHRGPGKCNLATTQACKLADLIAGTAPWASSPKKIVEGIGAPFSHEYLRRALKLHPEARLEVEMGWFPLISPRSSDTTSAPIATPTAAIRLGQIVGEIGVSATLDMLAGIAAQAEAAE